MQEQGPHETMDKASIQSPPKQQEILTPIKIDEIEKELQDTPIKHEESVIDPIIEIVPTIESPTPQPETPRQKILQQEEETFEPKSPTATEKLKMIITGDDILIEYVNRLIVLIENIKQAFTQKWSMASLSDVELLIPEQIKYSLEMFARHKIWSNKLNNNEDKMPLVQRISKRHQEMVERRSRILKSNLKKQKLSPEEI